MAAREVQVTFLASPLTQISNCKSRAGDKVACGVGDLEFLVSTELRTSPVKCTAAQ